MIIPGSTNGCLDPLIYPHGDTTIVHESWAFDVSSTAWPQFHVELTRPSGGGCSKIWKRGRKKLLNESKEKSNKQHDT